MAEHARALRGWIEEARTRSAALDATFETIEPASDVGGNMLAGALSYRLFVTPFRSRTSPSRASDCWPAPSSRRAYVGASARGNSLYHYYACSGRKSSAAKAATGSIPATNPEAAVIHQLATLLPRRHPLGFPP